MGLQLGDNLANYRVLRVLGRGSEGTVYIVKYKKKRGKLVLKVFHEPHDSHWFPGLEQYAANIGPNEYGLPDITLLYHGDKIIGAVYPYKRAYPIHWRLFHSIERVAQSIVGSYAQKQYFLMSEHGLALFDQHLSHFLVDREGCWNYIDVGAGIRSIDDRRGHEFGYIGYRFASLLLGIYNINITHLMQPIEDYRYDEPCVYWQNPALDDIGVKHPWVNEIISEIRSHDASIFLNPKLYQRISEHLPHRAPLPALLLPASKILYWRGSLYEQLRRTYST